MSKNVILLGVGLYLLMTLRNSVATGTSTSTAKPGGLYVLPSNNNNTAMWLQSGALQVAGGLLKEAIRGAATVAAVDTGSAMIDSWAGTTDFSLGDWA